MLRECGVSKPFSFTKNTIAEAEQAMGEFRKLNQTIFADSPDWAEWAAVDASGAAYAYQTQPFLDYSNWVVHGGRIYPVGYFDAADWKNSLIRRVRQDDEAIRFDMSVGQKFDEGKHQWSLLPWSALRVVVAVLGFGAQKYAPNQWQDVPEAKTRYADAALRHLTAWMCGEQLDPESKLPHLAHAVCCLLFLIWFDNKEDAKHEEL